ncbi:NADAR family protein [Epibacterium sp. DP7N7-1]|nr:NADAR family protein [Epibacterium sp. DP7N7-1]
MAEVREYKENSCAVFHRTRDEYGAFSNMASGFSYRVGDVEMLSSEHHYQASRFPENPEIQRMILGTRSPIMAKRKAYEFIAKTRKDWTEVNIRIMRHCIQLRYAFNRPRLSGLYEQSGDQPIVEKSMRDDFWGAKPTGSGMLRGINALGRLHMGHRQDIKLSPELFSHIVAAPDVDRYRIMGEDIGVTQIPEGHASPGWQAGFDL